MRISAEGARKFNSLYTMLLYYAGQERKILPIEMNLDEFRDSPTGLKIRCRDAIYEPTPIIRKFLDANEELLSAEARSMLDLWARNHVRGTFAVMRHLKNYSVFLDADGTSTGYAVLGLTEEPSDVIPKAIMPALVKTVLMPHDGVIVFDGLVQAAGHVTLDPDARRQMNAEYQAIRRSGELITRLD